jgi:hypothetical protein
MVAATFYSDPTNPSVLKQVGGSETYLPLLFAFYCSGDEKLVRLGKNSLEQVLTAMRDIFNQQLETEDHRELNQAEIAVQVRRVGTPIDPAAPLESPLPKKPRDGVASTGSRLRTAH